MRMRSTPIHSRVNYIVEKRDGFMIVSKILEDEANYLIYSHITISTIFLYQFMPVAVFYEVLVVRFQIVNMA